MRHHHLAQAARGRCGHRGQHAAYRTQAPVQPQLAKETPAVRTRPAHPSRRARIATAMPRSKPPPRLDRLAGDNPTVIRRCGHGLAAGDDRRADPVLRLAQRRVGQADEEQPDQAVLDVGLDLDRMALHPDQGHRVGTGQCHVSRPADVLDGEWPSAWSRMRPTTSIRTSSNSTPCAPSQRTASRRSRRCFRG